MADAAGKLEGRFGSGPVRFEQSEPREIGRIAPAMGEIVRDRAEAQQRHRFAQSEFVASPHQVAQFVEIGGRSRPPRILIGQQRHQRPIRIARIEPIERQSDQPLAFGAQIRNTLDDRPALELAVGQRMRGIVVERASGQGRMPALLHAQGRPISVRTVSWNALTGPSCTSP